MPGYVLAKLELNDEVYHLVKNTPKVTGFLGPNGKPQPIPDAQAARMLDTSEEAPPTRPSRRSASIMRSATASRCWTARSPASTAWSRNSISTGPGEGVGVDLRAGYAGGAGVRAGRAGKVSALRLRGRQSRAQSPPRRAVIDPAGGADSKSPDAPSRRVHAHQLNTWSTVIRGIGGGSAAAPVGLIPRL